MEGARKPFFTRMGQISPPSLPALYPSMGEIYKDNNGCYLIAALGPALCHTDLAYPASVLKELLVQ